jgi:DNA repair protein RecO (recombination protein O)
VESCQDIALLKMHFYLKFLMQQGVLNPEPWMGPLLKTNIMESHSLAENQALKKEISLQLSMMESATQQYLQTAEHH